MRAVVLALLVLAPLAAADAAATFEGHLAVPNRVLQKPPPPGGPTEGSWYAWVQLPAPAQAGDWTEIGWSRSDGLLPARVSAWHYDRAAFLIENAGEKPCPAGPPPVWCEAFEGARFVLLRLDEGADVDYRVTLHRAR